MSRFCQAHIGWVWDKHNRRTYILSQTSDQTNKGEDLYQPKQIYKRAIKEIWDGES